MVALDTVRSVNAKLVQSQPIVAVVTGGTSGIGEYTVRALAAQHGKTGKGLRVYIVGRNEEAAKQIIADCLKVCPDGEFIFVKANDLSLLKDVDRCSSEILKLEEQKANQSGGKIDILVMCHAELLFGPRRETEEGLDKTMAFLYYSRMRFISNLLPLLRASSLPAHVVSVFGAGLEKSLPKWHPDDLSLRGPDAYSMSACRTHVIVMTTFYFELLATQNPGKLSLTHEFPGLVITPAFKKPSLPWWFKLIWATVRPVIHLFRPVVSPEETGERVLFLCSERYPARNESGVRESAEGDLDIAMSTDGVRGNGAYSVKHTGETNDVEGLYASLRKQGFAEKIQKHTEQAFATIGGGKVFKD